MTYRFLVKLIKIFILYSQNEALRGPIPGKKNLCVQMKFTGPKLAYEWLHSERTWKWIGIHLNWRQFKLNAICSHVGSEWSHSLANFGPKIFIWQKVFQQKAWLYQLFQKLDFFSSKLAQAKALNEPNFKPNWGWMRDWEKPIGKHMNFWTQCEFHNSQ